MASAESVGAETVKYYPHTTGNDRNKNKSRASSLREKYTGRRCDACKTHTFGPAKQFGPEKYRDGRKKYEKFEKFTKVFIIFVFSDPRGPSRDESV